MKIKLLNNEVLSFRYIYLVKRFEVCDGDTVFVWLDQGFNQQRVRDPLRFYGYDAPETRAYSKFGKLKDLHKQAGLKAKRWLEEYLNKWWCGDSYDLFAASIELTGRRRPLGDLLVALKDEETNQVHKPRSVTAEMAKRGILLPTDGPRRRTWTKKELQQVIEACDADF